MSTTDPISDMLTRIRNAVAVRHTQVVMPASRLKEAVARVLRDEGYISRYEVIRDGRFPMLKVYPAYDESKEPVITGLERISKPGCRVYSKREDIPWVRSGLGTIIVSTPKGVVSGKEARQLGVGGEIICKVW